jgi:hypothetical protein
MRALKFGMVLNNWSSVTSFRFSLAVAAGAAAGTLVAVPVAGLAGEAVAAAVAAGTLVAAPVAGLVDAVAAAVAAGVLAGADTGVFSLVAALPQAAKANVSSAVMTRVRNVRIARSML